MAMRTHSAGWRIVRVRSPVPSSEAKSWPTASQEQFLTGGRSVNDINATLATVLFTDIVDSIAHAARLGDTGLRLSCG